MPSFSNGLTPARAKENYGLIISASDIHNKKEQDVRKWDRDFVSYIFKDRNIIPIEVINPTKEKLIEEINSIKSKTNSDNVTYIYISCHGNTAGLAMVTKNSVKDTISYRELKQLLDPIKGKKVLLIESCHSASCITEPEDLAIVNSSLFNTSVNEGDVHLISGVFRDKNYFVLAACSANQETPFKYGEGSTFTRYMCNSISAGDNQGYVTLGEMCEYVRKKGRRCDYYPEDSDFPLFGDSIIHAHSTYYLVEAKVANIKFAGTDANIRIRFIGNRGSSKCSYLLDHKKINDFEQNQVYKYMIECNDSIGTLKKVEISSDNIGEDPALLLEYIKVTNTSKNRVYKTSSLSSYVINEKNPSRTFDLKMLNYHTYNVTITIGKEDGAGTDADVCIQFVGKNGPTEKYPLDSPVDDFERASFNTYRVKTIGDIGELRYVNIASDLKGKSPEFHITHVVIEDMETHKRYSSPKSAYFDSKCREHSFILQEGYNVEYFVNIQIADIKNAGTNANIYIKLEGTKNKTDFILLDTPEKDDFERNTYNLFKVNADSLGDLKKVYIKNGYEGKNADMKIKYIEITDKSINQKYRVDCDCWLDSKHGNLQSFSINA